MHRPNYIELIEEASISLEIECKHLSEDWAIQLRKNGLTKYIIGNTFPLNDASFYKISGNKNLCSDILEFHSIPNIPHKVLLNPSLLLRRGKANGNQITINNFISEHGFPFLLKKNNSSKGEGVHLVKNEVEFENSLLNIFSTDSTLCLSPFRENTREFRLIILEGKCLLAYEKQIPFLIGDDRHNVLELITAYLKNKNIDKVKPEKYFNLSLLERINYVPKLNEKIYLQWKHNRFLGTSYRTIYNQEIINLAIKATIATNANFATVDIIDSDKFGLEVLEMSPSVSIHYPLIDSESRTNFLNEKQIYELALKKLFGL